MTFTDILALWVLVVGPILAWVFLFWITHRDSYATRHQKEVVAQMGSLNKSLDRIAAGGKKK